MVCANDRTKNEPPVDCEECDKKDDCAVKGIKMEVGGMGTIGLALEAMMIGIDQKKQISSLSRGLAGIVMMLGEKIEDKDEWRLLITNEAIDFYNEVGKKEKDGSPFGLFDFDTPDGTMYVVKRVDKQEKKSDDDVSD